VVVEGKGQFGGEFGDPIVTSGDFATQLLPNYFWQDLLKVQNVQFANNSMSASFCK